MMHSQAFNLARRLSDRNEPDLLRKFVSPCYSRFDLLHCFLHLSHGSSPASVDESLVEGKIHEECSNSRSCIFIRNIHSRSKDSSADDDGSTFSRDFCKAIAAKMCVDSSFPSECKRFPDLVSELQRRNSDKSDHAIAFAGMSAGEQAAAMAAREHGHLAHAQVQRRLTSSRRFQK
jgi:hypothetical protein